MRKSSISVILTSIAIALLLSTAALAVETVTITSYDRVTNTLTWGAVPNVADYSVTLYETNVPSGAWLTVVPTPATATSVILTPVQRGNGYYAYVTATGNDSSTSVSDPYYIDLLYPAAPTVLEDGLGTITGFQWTTPISPVNPAVPVISNYIIEVTGSNGLIYEATVPGTTTSIAFDPATWWPTGNVYSSYRARVRAINAEGKESEWSEYSTEGTLPLPQISTYSYEILKLPSETGITQDSTINDREVLVRWNRLDSFPGTFINWDPDKVTWDLEVNRIEIGSLPPSETYYSIQLPNQETQIAHVVPVGEDGKLMRHSFFFRPFYDGVPLYTGPVIMECLCAASSLT